MDPSRTGSGRPDLVMKSWLLPGETMLRSTLMGAQIEVDDASGCPAATFELDMSCGTIALANASERASGSSTRWDARAFAVHSSRLSNALSVNGAGLRPPFACAARRSSTLRQISLP